MYISRMSHSDSEIKCEKDKLRKTLHIEFKRKKKSNDLYRLMRFTSMMDEIRLMEAVSVNNVELAEKYLKSGISPDTIDLQSRSLLHIAVSRGYKDMVRLLLEHGANPNKKDVLKNTPLHLAACTYNLPIITLLIEFGADVNSLDIRGRNPLELARSKLQLLHRNWKDGSIEMTQFRLEIQQIIDLLLTIWMRKPQNAITHKPANVDELQFMTLSLNDDNPLDSEMSKLLSELQEFTIS